MAEEAAESAFDMYRAEAGSGTAGEVAAPQRELGFHSANSARAASVPADAGSLSLYRTGLAVLGSAVVLLVLGQVYSLSLVRKAHLRLDEIEEALIEAKTVQQKVEAEQDKRLIGAVDEKIKTEIGTVKQALYRDALNRLRGGQEEKKLLRKPGGEWAILNGRAEQPLTAPESLEALNFEYRRCEKSLTNSSLPPHTPNVICLLKSDGKGGTLVRFTNEYILGGK